MALQPRRQRAVERLQVGLEVGGVRRLQGRQVSGHQPWPRPASSSGRTKGAGSGCCRAGRARCWTVITLRAGVRRRRLDLVHERVVADAVLHDQLRRADLLAPPAGSPRRCAGRCSGCSGSTDTCTYRPPIWLSTLAYSFSAPMALMTVVPLRRPWYRCCAAAGGRQRERGEGAGQDRPRPPRSLPLGKAEIPMRMNET